MKDNEAAQVNILDAKTQTLLENIFDGVYVVDCNRRIVYWNPAAERITGYLQNEMQGRNCAENILNHVDGAGNCQCTGNCPLVYAMRDGRVRDTEMFLHHKSGHRMPMRVRTIPILDDSGAVIGSIEIFRETRNQEALHDRLVELEKLALLDALTQLPNRRYAQAQLEAGLSQFEAHNQPFSILFIDIDHFKSFNDDHGHATGDQALRTIAGTLINTIRPQDTAARWGGEEFVAIFPNTDTKTLGVIASRLCAMIRTSSVEISGISLKITVSIGGTIAKPGDTVETLVDRADAMMYQGKQGGRNRFIIEGCPG